MKKMEYLNPEMTIVEVQYNQIICASYGDEPGYGGGGTEENIPD